MTAREQMRQRQAQRRRDAIARSCALAAALVWLWDFHELSHPTAWAEAHALGLAISLGTCSFSLLCAVVYLIARTFRGGER